MENTTTKYISLLIGGQAYKTWDKTSYLLTVFNGGYCEECGCINNYKLIYDYVPCIRVGDKTIYEDYRVIGFDCLDCKTKYRLRIY